MILLNNEEKFKLELTPNGFIKRQEPIEEAAPAEDEQTRLLALCLKDPTLNSQPIRVIAKKHGFKKNQVERFRKRERENHILSESVSAPGQNPE